MNEAQLAQMNDAAQALGPQVLGPMQTLWAEALESGNYTQYDAGGVMCIDYGCGNEYCCLGVLAHIFDLRKSYSGLCEGEYEKIGLLSELGLLKKPLKTDDDKFYTLSHMNDGVMRGGVRKRFTFPEIAAYIRANPSNVFSKSV